MAKSTNELELILQLQADQFSREMTKVNRELEKLNKTSETMAKKSGSIFSGFLGAGIALKGIDAVTSALGNLGSEMIMGNAKMETYKTSFATMLGSMEKANVLMEQVKQFGAETPYEFPELADSTKKLLAFGIAQEEIIPRLRNIGDIASGVGIPINELAEIFGKAKVQGVLMNEDINQLLGRGIPIAQEFAKQLGVSPGEIKKLAEQGRITFPMLEQAFVDMTSNGGQFAGMMEAQSQTFAGMMSTLQDTLSEIARQIGGPLFEQAKVALEGLAGALADPAVQAGIEAFADILGELVGFIAKHIDVILPIVGALVAYEGAIKVANTATKAFNAVLNTNPLALYATAVAALVIGISELSDALNTTQNELLENQKAEESLIQSKRSNVKASIDEATNTQALVARFKELSSETRLTKEEEEELTRIKGELNTQYPGLIQNTKDFSTQMADVDRVSQGAKTAIEDYRKQLKQLDQDLIAVRLRQANTKVYAELENLNEGIAEQNRNILNKISKSVFGADTVGDNVKNWTESLKIGISKAVTDADLTKIEKEFSDAIQRGQADEGLSSKSADIAYQGLQKVIQARRDYLALLQASREGTIELDKITEDGNATTTTTQTAVNKAKDLTIAQLESEIALAEARNAAIDDEGKRLQDQINVENLKYQLAVKRIELTKKDETNATIQNNLLDAEAVKLRTVTAELQKQIDLYNEVPEKPAVEFGDEDLPELPDVTETDEFKKQEDALKERERLYNSFFDSVGTSALAFGEMIGGSIAGKDQEWGDALKQMATAVLSFVQAEYLAAQALLFVKAILTSGITLTSDMVWSALAYAGIEVAKGFINSLDVGTPYVPEDQISKIHKGEMVVPRTWNEALMSGQISISGGKKKADKVKVDMYVSNFQAAQRYSEYAVERVRL
jgi:tape measure domain-containing protein